MTQQDLEMLDEEEVRVVDDSFDRQGPQNRIRIISLSAIATLAIVALFVTSGMSAVTIGGMFGFYVALTTLEKLTYTRGQMVSRSAMSKIIRRLEVLEQVPVTPDNGRPSQKARMIAA